MKQLCSVFLALALLLAFAAGHGAFAATTGAVKHHHFDLVHAAFLEDDGTRDFIEAHNAPALREIAQRLAEAIDRGLWVPRSNSARALIDSLV